MALVSMNPATGEILKEYREWSADEVDAALERADTAWKDWRTRPAEERVTPLEALAGIVRTRREELAAIVSQEVGKAIGEARAEIAKCAAVCDYYREKGPGFLRPEEVESDGVRSYVRFEPLGLVLAVMPWNFPFWQVFRAAVPALTAGNGVVLKHASNAMWSARSIEGLFREARFPENLFTTLQISAGGVEQVIADSRVRGVTLTGSVEAGRRVAALAGRYLKKTVLELGGSDPFIVLEDADLERAAETAARARTMNAGQSCIAAKRFIVLEEVYEKFLDLFRTKLEGIRVGNPAEDDTDIGSLAKEEFLDQLQSQIDRSVAAGAKVLLGGTRIPGQGAFFPPTLIADAAPGMACWEEELFGPVATLIRARDEDDAIRIANGTAFGLGASVWTRDLSRGEAIAARIEAGAVFVNGMVKSDPRLPFGGIKDSGYGRELSGFGIREFVNVKTVWVAE